jgi:hypothetical protein
MSGRFLRIHGPERIPLPALARSRESYLGDVAIANVRPGLLLLLGAAIDRSPSSTVKSTNFDRYGFRNLVAVEELPYSHAEFPRCGL